MPQHRFRCAFFDWNFSRTCIMGILNVTPDSFSDGGQFDTLDRAVEQALKMQEQGAAIIDVGGQSTRPGSTPVSAADELARLMPIMETLRTRLSIPISVDTFYPSVAQAMLERGAAVINDVSGTANPDMACVVRRFGAGWILTDRGGVSNGSITQAVGERLDALATEAQALGVARDALCIDPGFGFGKDHQENVQMLRNLSHTNRGGYTLLAGMSRKRFLGWLTGLQRPADRDTASVAAQVLATAAGADILRVHNVAAAVQAARVADDVCRGA